MIRIHLTSKPHKVGGTLGKLLSRLQFNPPSTALSTPFLHDLPRDGSALQTVASKFCAALNGKGMVAIVGGKKTSIKPNFAEKFSKAFTTAYRDPEFEKEVKDTGTIPLDPSIHAFTVECHSPAASVMVAQVLSHYGVVSQYGKEVSLTIDEGCGRYSRMMSIHALMNEHRTEHVINGYTVLAKRDVVGGKSLGGILAVAGISCGLPIASMLPLLSDPSIKPSALAKEVATAAAKLKEMKPKPKSPASSPPPKSGKRSALSSLDGEGTSSSAAEGESAAPSVELQQEDVPH
jgi:hypothetical protein